MKIYLFIYYSFIQEQTTFWGLQYLVDCNNRAQLHTIVYKLCHWNPLSLELQHYRAKLLEQSLSKLEQFDDRLNQQFKKALKSTDWFSIFTEKDAS